MRPKAKNVDEYIAWSPPETRLALEQIRSTIKEAAPDAEEVISYAMPGYRLNGMLVWFAGYDKHIGFYPGEKGIAEFRDELSGYKSAKGSVQFPLSEPLPKKLITRIVESRAAEDLSKIRIKE